MKVYLSGKVSGLPHEEVKQKFAKAELDVWTAYSQITTAQIVNPYELCPESWGWWRSMAKCVWHLLPCDTIFMLTDWRESRGARIERLIAKLTFKHIVYQKESEPVAVEDKASYIQERKRRIAVITDADKNVLVQCFADEIAESERLEDFAKSLITKERRTIVVEVSTETISVESKTIFELPGEVSGSESEQ